MFKNILIKTGYRCNIEQDRHFKEIGFNDFQLQNFNKGKLSDEGDVMRG